MTKRVVISALFCALAVLSTGCGDECQDAFDCRNDNGQPGEGQRWVCNAGTCEQRPVDQPAEEDAGTDAGTTEDAGVDAGIDAGTDAGVDAGTDAGVDAGVDAGSMSVAKDGTCISSGDCQPGLRCEGSPLTCQAMHLAVTGQGVRGARTIKALVMRHDEAGETELTAATTDSRYPRWNRDGTAVAYAQGVGATTAGELIVRTLPVDTGTTTVVADGGTGNTESFRYMEWEPGQQIIYVRQSGSSRSGISVVAPNGGTVTQATANGTFPDWSADGTSFAYSAATLGLFTSTVGGTATPIANSGGSAEQPHFNRANNQLLHLANPDNRSVTFTGDTFATPLHRLHIIPVTGGGQPQLIADYRSETVTGGTIDSYIANPNWAPDGSWVAYVRVYFSNPTAGTPALCGTAAATLCPTAPRNVIYLRRIDPATGAGVGEESRFVEEATLPSFSPDAHHVAYIQSGALRVWRINPVTGDKVGTDPFSHPTTDFTVLTGDGDDHRPRWQPK
jgi:hypothetical protein